VIDGGRAGLHRRARNNAAPEEDGRFRGLVGDAGWLELPQAIRKRFSKRVGSGVAVVYRGWVAKTALSRAGRALAILARSIGGPLPLHPKAQGPAIVSVTEDASTGDQHWVRTYTCPGRRPQVVHSMKRFRGATGLEEYVGCGIGMALAVRVAEGGLVFQSDHYFFEIGRFRVPLPHALSPGQMVIVHREETGGLFSFRLTLTHPRLGCLIHHLAYFAEV
jgi:hypothetical protein